MICLLALQFFSRCLSCHSLFYTVLKSISIKEDQRHQDDVSKKYL